MADNVKPFLRYDNLDKVEVLRHNFQMLESRLYNQTTNNTTADGTATDLTTHVADTDNPHEVNKTDVSLSNVVNTLHKFDATAAPTVNDDSGDGYSVGSMWFDVTNDKAYGCLDATATAAVWTELTQSGGGGSTFTTRLMISMAGNWSLSSGSVQKMVGFDTVDEDDNSDWDAANKRMTVPTTGWYLCTTGLEIASNSAGTRVAYFYESTVRKSRGSTEPHASDGCSWTHTKMIYLTASNYLEVYAYQNSGSTLNVVAGVGSFFQVLGPILT